MASMASALSKAKLDKAARKEQAEADKLAGFNDAIECFEFLCEQVRCARRDLRLNCELYSHLSPFYLFLSFHNQSHIKTFASQAADSLYPHLKEQRFELDLALLTKDDLSSVLMEFLAGYRHFTEVHTADGKFELSLFVD